MTPSTEPPVALDDLTSPLLVVPRDEDPADPHRSGTVLVVRGFLAAGRGIAIVPAPSTLVPARPTPEEALLRITDDGAVHEAGLTWSEPRRLLPSAELFRKHVLNTVGDIRSPDDPHQ